MKDFYSKIIEKAQRILILFMSTHLCKAGFFTLLQIKIKQRNRLNVEDDLRLLCSKLFHAFSNSRMINKHKFRIN